MADTLSHYFDLQVNGYAGVDFNADDIGSEKLHRACAAMRADGVEGALATIITANLDAMVGRLRQIVAGRQADRLVAAVIEGLHIEGPFISDEAGYVGAHPAIYAREASLDAAKRLVDAGGGLVRLVTLAPERDPAGHVTRWLTDQGVRVSAGHCNPSLDQLRAAIDAGLCMFTHLGNGCPLQMHRHDNIVQRVLSLADRLWVSFIADGVHLPFYALKNYVALVGEDRTIVVSDAIAAAGMGPGAYQLAGQEVLVDERLATWAADRSHLMGSACTMQRMDANLRRELKYSAEVVTKLMSVNPRRALGIA